jgi:hypothetical protein
MRYDEVQASLEKFILDNWTATTSDAIQFDNVAFNSDIYDTFLQCHIAFGDSVSRALIRGCFRQVGVLFLTVYTRPSKGSQAKLALASQAADMI